MDFIEKQLCDTLLQNDVKWMEIDWEWVDVTASSDVVVEHSWQGLSSSSEINPPRYQKTFCVLVVKKYIFDNEAEVEPVNTDDVSLFPSLGGPAKASFTFKL